jgi:large subunit ribosomal protein L17
MRHQKRKRNLGISASHRRSLLSNLAVSILDKERIITTVAKAKEVRGLVERLITYGKKGDLNSIRIAGKIITDKTILKKLFSEISPSFKDREGGYTRIVKLGERKGDNAPTAIIELTGRNGQEIANRRKKQKKAGAGTPAVATETKVAGASVDASAETPVKESKAQKTKKSEGDKAKEKKAEKAPKAKEETSEKEPKEKKAAPKKKKESKEKEESGKE